jgi:protein TonB
MNPAVVLILLSAVVPATQPAPPPRAPASSPPVSAPSSIGAPHLCLQDYPAASVAAHEEGTTTVAFTITDTGHTDAVTVRTSSGSAALDAAAITCVNRWLYKPATKDGVPVAVPWKAEVRWSMVHPEGSTPPPTPTGDHSCAAFRPLDLKVPAGAMTTLAFVVTPAGVAKNVTIAASSGNAELDGAALKCAAGWHFAPAILNGQPVSARAHENVPWSAP